MTNEPQTTTDLNVRPEKIIGVMKSIGLTLQAEGMTGNEYITILHNLVSQVLAQNPKQLEKDFFANVKHDVLQRRLKKLREEEESLKKDSEEEFTSGALEIAEGTSTEQTDLNNVPMREMTDAEKQAHAEDVEYAHNQGEVR